MKHEDDDQKVTECKLSDGTILHYDLCSNNLNAYNSIKGVRYIGMGVIYSIDGALQNSNRKLYFFQKV